VLRLASRTVGLAASAVNVTRAVPPAGHADSPCERAVRDIEGLCVDALVAVHAVVDIADVTVDGSELAVPGSAAAGRPGSARRS
jgi:hypothetical protein